MTRWGSVLLGSVPCCALVLLSACAALRPTPDPTPAFLFQDESFVAPEERFTAQDLFALDDSMRRYLREDIGRQLRWEGPVSGLIDALYQTDQLKLRYDATRTRTASEAFDARAGNCLSLVIMTAAFAKEMGLQVRYNAATTEEVWSRNAGMLVGSAHVNVTLEPAAMDLETHVYMLPRTVDFLPAEEISNLRVREISEQKIVAMYMNNLAVEALSRDELNDAYGWARAAIRRSPDFANSYNTLGVIYVRRGDLAQAARVFRYQLEHRSNDATVMANLADVLARMGNEAEAADLRAQLARIDPDPPYHYFDLAMEAIRRNDYQAARKLFAKEVSRADYNDEFHYWLGVAYFKLGEVEQARKQLTLALARTRTGHQHDLYTAKLAWLQSNDRSGSVQALPAAPPQ